MCDCEPTRREAIGKFVAVGAALVAGHVVASASAPAAQAAPPAVPAVEVMPGLSIYPRDAWGVDLPPTGPIYPEKPQFLLVHHTESPNSYTNARDVIRSVYSFHTGPQKGWSDVCYQFFVGHDGDVW